MTGGIPQRWTRGTAVSCNAFPIRLAACVLIAVTVLLHYRGVMSERKEFRALADSLVTKSQVCRDRNQLDVELDCLNRVTRLYADLSDSSRALVHVRTRLGKITHSRCNWDMAEASLKDVFSGGQTVGNVKRESKLTAKHLYLPCQN